MLSITEVAFRRRLISAILLPVLLMLLLAGVSIWQISRLLVVMQWVEHTDQVIAQANRVQRLLTEVESGIRGYLLTEEPEFLAPYQQSSVLVEPAFIQLFDLVSDNPPQVQRLVALQEQYREWNQFSPALIADAQAGENVAPVVVRSRNQVMNSIRRQMAEFIQVEEQLRNVRVETVQRTTRLVISSSLALAILLSIVLAYLTRRQILSVSKSYEYALSAAQEQTHAARRSSQRLAALHDIDRAILAAQSVESLAHEALSRLKRIAAYDQGAVVLFNFEQDEVEILAGKIAGNLPGALKPIAQWLPSELLRCRAPSWYIQDIAALIHRPPALEALLAEGYRSFLAVALLAENGFIGDLNLVAFTTDAFSLETQEIAQEVANQLAIAIQQSKLRQQLEEHAAHLEQRVIERTANLQEANEALEAFSYTIAHDLKAPVRGIEGYATALLEDFGEQLDDAAKDYVQHIFASSDRMNALVQDLLSYSRLSREEIRLMPINLGQVVAEAQAQLEALLQEHHAAIAIEEPLPNVMGHPSILVQIVVNLLSNAVKFIEPETPPQIRIWAETSGGWVRLWVADNGIGIEPHYQEQVFGVFERLHSRDMYPGTGIGLAIVRKGAERMGGKTGVESQVGQGSQFWVEFKAV